MTYEDLSKVWGSGLVDGVLGEEIAYLAYPATIFSTINAVVTRTQPVEVEGERTDYQVEVTVAKDDVSSVEPGLDRVRLIKDKRLGERAPEFVVHEVVNESPGYFQLICTQ